MRKASSTAAALTAAAVLGLGMTACGPGAPSVTAKHRKCSRHDSSGCQHWVYVFVLSNGSRRTVGRSVYDDTRPGYTEDGDGGFHAPPPPEVDDPVHVDPVVDPGR